MTRTARSVKTAGLPDHPTRLASISTNWPLARERAIFLHSCQAREDEEGRLRGGGRGDLSTGHRRAVIQAARFAHVLARLQLWPQQVSCAALSWCTCDARGEGKGGGGGGMSVGFCKGLKLIPPLPPGAVWHSARECCRKD